MGFALRFPYSMGPVAVASTMMIPTLCIQDDRSPWILDCRASPSFPLLQSLDLYFRSNHLTDISEDRDLLVYFLNTVHYGPQDQDYGYGVSKAVCRPVEDQTPSPNMLTLITF